MAERVTRYREAGERVELRAGCSTTSQRCHARDARDPGLDLLVAARET